jgi:hypothetical protein
VIDNKLHEPYGPSVPVPGVDPIELDDNDRRRVLREADKLVNGDRNNQYGPPHQDFARAAEIASAILGAEIDAHHIAMIQIAVKLSRLTWDPSKFDSWVDLAGYAACGYEAYIRTNEGEG